MHRSSVALLLAALGLAGGCRFFEVNPDFVDAGGDEVATDTGADSTTGGSLEGTESTSEASSTEDTTEAESSTESTESTDTDTDTDTMDTTESTDTTESSDTTESTDTETTETETDGSGTGGSFEGMVADAANEMRIDATEVRVADYAAFLDAGPILDLPADCDANQTYVPNDWDAQFNGDQDEPVVWVDWCDAYAFCEWQGKHLCGAVGGGAGSPALLDDLTSEWYRACVGESLTNAYPYGPGHIPGLCNENGDREMDGPLPVGAAPGCEGGLAGLFDMSGNVWEWTNSCDDQEGTCLRRGGGYSTEPSLAACDISSLRTRDYQWKNTGLRCCADPE
ncbi:hypothetical protein PPSIR1_17390 [Plesiocystis pacifica SIR-1]|uniref:Sulfatase-modifying factor enzyme-like domain-containing protein n=1 Tax=Plesiocystis pacifica SIR-1 TaxID=391625 RepID=A6GA43_9BACT|nr:formylglycine-generating enzyme family protein [Plesiocystis pacifica]EDM77256.1 hypothetical protein PPSIR1_17390 [Plesiocystis pacifica SIR-1]